MLSNEAIKWSQQGHLQMEKLSVIESSIRKHGARAVFKATFEWDGNDYAPLEAMGVDGYEKTDLSGGQPEMNKNPPWS